MATNNADIKAALGQLEDKLETYLVDKAPYSIPKEWKEIIVKYSPWISVLMMVVALPAILGVLGLSSMMIPFGYLGGMRYGFSYVVSLVFSIGIIILQAIAIPGLFKRSINGWRMVYYASLLGVVQNLLTFNIGGIIIGGLLSMYILFQVKDSYK